MQQKNKFSVIVQPVFWNVLLGTKIPHRTLIQVIHNYNIIKLHYVKFLPSNNCSKYNLFWLLFNKTPKN